MQIQEKKSAAYEIIKNPKNDRQKTNTNDTEKYVNIPSIKKFYKHT